MSGILLSLAHPDDESFLGGGTLAHYARRGVPTALLCATDGQAGRAGLTGQPPLVDRAGLGPLRREELRRAAALLGIGELITPGWPDGGLAAMNPEPAIAFIADQIRRLRPQIVISFGPEGAPSHHADHIAIARWTEDAIERAADPAAESGLPPHQVRKLYWITWPEPVNALRGGAPGAPITSVIALDPDLDPVKRAAFAEHRTQQDFLEIFTKLQDLLQAKEYFHLAAGPTPNGQERDLFE